MTPEYLAQLIEAYNYYFYHYEETPLLVVDTNEIDFVNRPADFDDLVARSRGRARACSTTSRRPRRRKARVGDKPGPRWTKSRPDPGRTNLTPNGQSPDLTPV